MRFWVETHKTYHKKKISFNIYKKANIHFEFQESANNNNIIRPWHTLNVLWIIYVIIIKTGYYFLLLTFHKAHSTPVLLRDGVKNDFLGGPNLWPFTPLIGDTKIIIFINISFEPARFIFYLFFIFFLKVLVPPWGTGRCDSRPGLVLSIVERSSFVGRLLLRLLLRDYMHTFEGWRWRALHNPPLFRSLVVVA